MMWLNRSVATINVMLQLLDIHRLEREREIKKIKKKYYWVLILRLHLVLCKSNSKCKMNVGESEFP